MGGLGGPGGPSKQNVLVSVWFLLGFCLVLWVSVRFVWFLLSSFGFGSVRLVSGRFFGFCLVLLVSVRFAWYLPGSGGTIQLPF